MCHLRAALAAVIVTFVGIAPPQLQAQQSAAPQTASAGSAPSSSAPASTSAPSSDPSPRRPPPRDSNTMRFARYRQYPWNGVSVWAGNAYETRSASHNQHIAGSFRILGVQISRDIFRGKKNTLSYMGEVLPLMLARSGPPANRMPDTLHTPPGYYSDAELKRFTYRDAVGFGIAPLGLEYTYQAAPRLSAVVNMTAGALLFNKIVPYGRGTKPNFTVSPGAALQWEPQSRTRIAFGYTFHHLSNASFGEANPGMNSQVLYVRVSRLRRQVVER